MLLRPTTRFTAPSDGTLRRRNARKCSIVSWLNIIELHTPLRRLGQARYCPGGRRCQAWASTAEQVFGGQFNRAAPASAEISTGAPSPPAQQRDLRSSASGQRLPSGSPLPKRRAWRRYGGVSIAPRTAARTPDGTERAVSSWYRGRCSCAAESHAPCAPLALTGLAPPARATVGLFETGEDEVQIHLCCGCDRA